ncbi:MAG: hypothetical protein M3Z01_05085 [Thermoproteota archaeon]|nr:hypothetical protein [Thermoproteota archaeon]
MAFFKTFANNKTIFVANVILLMILVLTCSLLSNIASVFSQSPSDIQKGYKDFLTGETDIYDDLISGIQYIIQSFDDSSK